MLAISITTKMAFHLYAGALVLRGLVGWDVMTVVWIMGTVAACVTIIGGFTAVAYTDSIQTGIIILGLRHHVVHRAAPGGRMARAWP